MKNIILYIAVSLDGYIARSDGDLDWLSEYPITPELDYGYHDFFDSIGSVIMGGKTYRDILNMDVIYPYKDKISYIITHNEINTRKENIHFISDKIIETIINLKEREEKDIWLVGGGEIIALLLNHNLIDKMVITYIPKILGNGIPLFPNILTQSLWELDKVSSFDNNTFQSVYQIVKSAIVKKV